jgi:hypothetical protein
MENKSWSTGLPDFGINKVIKDEEKLVIKPSKRKSRVANYDGKNNKKEVWESFLDMVISVVVTWFVCLIIYTFVKMI